MKKLVGFILFVYMTAFAPAVSTATTHLRFIKDDYARALADAKRQELPLFVEVWAPW
jgi:hypothetical protein